MSLCNFHDVIFTGIERRREEWSDRNPVQEPPVRPNDIVGLPAYHSLWCPCATCTALRQLAAQGRNKAEATGPSAREQASEVA